MKGVSAAEFFLDAILILVILACSPKFETPVGYGLIAMCLGLEAVLTLLFGGF